MTIQEAFTLKTGDYIYHLAKKNADKTPMRARVTSVKTWKTRPADILIGFKHGMYDTGKLDASELSEFGIGYGS